MGIFDNFLSGNQDSKSGQQNQQQNQQQQQPANQDPNGAATPGNIPDPNLLSQQNLSNNDPSISNPANNGPESLLEPFKEIWDNDPNNPNNANNSAAPAELDPKEVQQVISKMDFSSVVPPETLQRIIAGGEEAAPALMQAFNSIAQNVLLRSTLVNNKLASNSIEAAITRQNESLPELLRSQSIQTYARDTNPLFSNPAVQPVIAATQETLSRKYPNATPAEITKMTEDYIKAMGEAFNPAATTTSDSAEQDMDWQKFLTS